MISASHNPYEDNGIKLFGPDGYKLSDADEYAIEALLEGKPTLVDAPHIGRAKRIDDARGRYIHFAKSTLARPYPPRRAQDRGRLRQWRGLSGRARGAVGIGRRRHRDRHQPQWHQHQRRLRVDRAADAAGNRGRVGGADRARARRRRRPADRGRRDGTAGRRRPVDGADRADPEAARDAQGRRRSWRR